MVALPRLVISAPSTGQGKTTIAAGLMAALRAAGHEVSGHKAGPDYIDPGYHALATGRPGRNLDPHLVGEQRIVPLLLHGAAGADIAVIEGVMGLFDGRLGTDGFASTAHVAALTATPVVLVMDVARQSRTAAAVASGLASFDPAVHVAGVVLNRAGSARNDAEITRALDRAGLPVLGTLPQDEAISAPSRHLGLVPASERGESAAMITRLGELVARHLDLAALLAVAAQAPDLDAHPWDPHREVRPPDRDAALPDAPPGMRSPAEARPPDFDAALLAAPSSLRPPAEVQAASRAQPVSHVRPVVAVAGGRAFTFRYTETEELLRAAGCDVVTFDPLTDTALPTGTRGIYLGGGFPEIYATELAANRSLLRDLSAAAAAGIPVVAECAGLLYLARSLDETPMAGVVPAAAAMTGQLTLRYPEATAACDSLLTRAGERVTGHEFHRTATVPAVGTRPAWDIDGTPTGFTTATVHASYLHIHWAGHPHLAQRFANAVHAAAPHGSMPPPSAALLRSRPADEVPVGDPLRHHGDTQAGGGLAGEAPVGDPLRHHGDGEAGGGLAGEALVSDPLRHYGDAGTGGGLADGVLVGDRLRYDGDVEVVGGVTGEAPVGDPLRHHGDTEAGDGLADFAVNIYPGERPAWLDRALHAAVDASAAYPDAAPAHAALAAHHGRNRDEVLATAGAAELFTMIARLRPWRRPTVVHPQFTEPHAALRQAGLAVTTVTCTSEDGFAFDPAAVPGDADLVMIGNPTNPTGVLHPAARIRQLTRPGRLVVVDEAFMEAVPDETASLAGDAGDGLLVLRSLTKHWSIPGIRAGYAVGGASLIAELAAAQTPWSVSVPAIAAMVACTGEEAAAEARRRALTLCQWRDRLQSGLRGRGTEHIPSSASFVLARLGAGARAALRARGVAVRRCDTFPGLDATWARIAVRPPAMTDRLLCALDQVRREHPAH